MSGTLPSANRPSLGGRVGRAAARGSLKLGVAAFNKMFPTVGKFMSRPKSSSGSAEPESINTSGEDISRGLFRQRALFRSILDNQQEQNRLLERLLLVYKNKPAAAAAPGVTPPPAPGPGIDMDLPMPDLPDRPRPQSQQRPPNRQRSFLRRYLTFLKRRAPRLYRAAARRIVIAAAGVAVPGPGWLMTVIAGLGSLFLAAELYKMYREFRASNSEDEDDDIETGIPSEEESLAEERAIDPAEVADPLGMLERPATPPPPAPVATGRLAFIQFDSRVRGAAGTAEQQQTIRTAAQNMGLDPSTVTGGALEGDRVTQVNVRGRRDPIRVPPPAQPEESATPPAPAPAPAPAPVRLDRQQLLSQIEAARVEAEGEERAEPADNKVARAIETAEFIAGVASVDDAIRQAESAVSGTDTPQAMLVNAIRVEGDTIIYDFDKIKYEAERIKFEGLTIPTQTVVTAPATPSPAAAPSPGATQSVAGGGSGFRPIQIMSRTLSALPRAPSQAPIGAAPMPSGAIPLTPGQTATRDTATETAPVTGTTAQILATIRARESGGNYQAQARGSTASGAYQFINSTWRSVTRKFNIGTEFERAIDAPPAVQDAVAAAYVNDILRANNNNVAVVPLVWYTGNAQGRMSEAALAANRGLTAEAYQRKWLADFAVQSGQTQVAQVPASGAAVAQASTSRTVADREQVMSTQRAVSAFNQQQASPSPARQTTPRVEVSEVPLRSRIMETFNHLAQAS